MNGTYRSANDPYLWYIYGGHTHAFQWGEFFAGGAQFDSQWLTLSRAGFNRTGELPFINLSSNLPSNDGDVRLEDRLTLDFEGTQYAVIKNVEYVDSTLDTTTNLRTYGHLGFATDASLESIYANVGNHEMSFTAAIKDNSLHLGDGGDAVNLVDHFDIPGQQYWSLIRQDGHQLDAYSLLTGRKIRMEDGQESLNGYLDYHNFGEVEWLHLANARSGLTDAYIPGQDILVGGDRGVFENIDLRTVEMVVDGGGYTATSVEFSDSFNLAYFNFIRYTSDNVWVGEATVSDGTNFSAASDRTVDVNKNVYLKSGYTVDAPVLDGQLSVIGQSRNGTHDLMVAEQASEIDGNLRLYTSQLETGLYNEFNQVFLGTSADDSSDKSIIDGSDWSDRVALYGFGGEDVLKAGAGRDYLFGGQSVYNQLNSDETGNQVTGGTGADYFGVGNTDSFGEVFGANSTIGTSATTGEFHQGYATDVIMDWHAEQDTVVVLSNGVAVIAGLRDESDVVSLNVGNTIDLRDHTAIATSDQDFDGARGGDDWDQIKSLDYIYNNQTTRDGNSITNEVDKTVVNDGLIVVRGMDGDDTLHGSSGDDYLYGNKGADLLTLSAGGTDRVYIDTLDSSLVSSNFASIYVAGFDVSDDQVFVNKGVVDAFYSGGSGRDLSASDVTGTYLSAVAYNSGVNFLHDKFYSPSIYDTNESHRNQDGAGAFGDNSGSDTSSSFGGGDGTSFVIGSGMFAAGTVLMFVPFMGPVGAALMASGTALGAGSSIITTTEHENATFSGNVGSYMNIITSDTLEAVTTSAATESVRNTDDFRFLDFFGASDAGDGFVPVVEFTAHAGEGIYGYFALHSAGGDDETFVYLVASSDNLVENSEAIKVAEVNGHLTAAHFKVYDGEEDIYNVGAEPDIILRTPTLVSVVDQNGDYGLQLPDDSGNSDNNDALIEKGGTPSSNSLSIGVELSGDRVTGTIIKIYDGTKLIFSGDENTNTEDSGGNVTAVYDNITNRFEISDGRSIGTVAFDSQVDPVTYQQNDPLVIDGVDNNFVLQDSIVNYSVELIDGVTGISTRAGSGAITVSGGDNVIDGGTETSATVLGDMLNITGTNDYINSTSDSNIVDIETILVSAMDTNGTGDDDTSTGFGEDGTPAIDDEDDGTTLNLSNQSDGFFVYGSSIADIITGSTGDDDINGMGGGDIIQLTSIGASLSTSGADRVRFVYSTDGDDADTVPDRMGADTGHDIISGMYSDDELFVEASSSNAPSTPLDGFDDRDGDTNRLLYETASGSENMQVASGTELLVLAASSVSASGDLTNNIASALESAFDVSGLDGNTPSNTSGGVTSTDSSLLFAVQSDVAGTYWFGRYEDQNNDDTIDGDTDIEVFANVATTDLLESFWLDTVLAPQALTINLPDDTFSLSPTYATNVATFSVGGLASGNSVYYSLNGGTDWITSTDSSGLVLEDGIYSAGAIKVRQLDVSGNYSPISEITESSIEFTVDTIAPSAPSFALANDTGIADGISSDGTVNVSGLETDATWEYSVNGGASWTAGSVTTFTLLEGSYAIGDIQVRQYDVAGNESAVIENPAVVAIDTTNPTVTSIEISDTALSIGEATTVTITFSEAVTGLEIADFTADNASLSNLSTATDYSDGTQSYTLTLTPGAPIEDTTNVVTLASGVVSDAVGLANTDSATSENYTVDNIAPSAPSFALANDTGIADGISSDGTVNVSGLETDATWEYSVNGGASWTAGSVTTFTLLEGSYAIGDIQVRQYDAAGNVGVVQQNPAVVAIDTTNPTVTSIEISDTALSIGEATTVTITFSEAVTGLEIADFTADNASLSNLSTATDYSDGTQSYTLTLTPGAPIEDTTNVVTLASGVVSDAVGLANTDSATSENYTVDNIAPSAPSFALANDTGIADGISSDGTVNVSGLETDATWEYSVNGGASWTAGSVTTFTLLEGSYAIGDIQVRQYDAAGNVGVVQQNPAVVAIDTTNPTFTAFDISDTALSIGDTTTVTITFSEAVTGLEIADFTADNASLSNLLSATDNLDGTQSYTLTLTPDASIEDTTNVVTLAPGAVLDAASNANAGSATTGNYTVDTSAPSAPSFALANDTGTDGDDISSDGTVNVSGIEAGATWEYSVNGGASWTAGSVTTFTLLEGSYAIGDIQVRQYDAAGNESAVIENTALVAITPSASYSLPANVDSSTDPNDNDSLFNNGNTGGDDSFTSADPTVSSIYAGAGDDFVNVDPGTQTIYGGSGDDVIWAGAGSDSLWGGSGADTLSGGAHSNHFFGGHGADIIIFQEFGLNNGETAYFLSTDDTGDTIRNFDPKRGPTGNESGSSDKLNFSSMDANDIVSGSQSFTFIEQSSTDLSANSISWFYDTAEGRIQLAADTDGNTSTAEFVIYIEDLYVQTLTSNDFTL